jgi:hypothetical protein
MAAGGVSTEVLPSNPLGYHTLPGNEEVHESSGRAVSLLVKPAFSFALTAVLLFVIEVGASFIPRAASYLPKQADFVISASSIYKGQTWAEKFFQEGNIAFNSEKYWPFVVWKMAPFQGETITIDENVLRRTFQSHCDDPNAYAIWI